jgi:hypothetical protein
VSGYPLFLCRDGTNLRADADDLKQDLVRVAAVTDPNGACSDHHLRSCFHEAWK